MDALRSKVLLVAALFLLTAPPALAHQPVLVQRAERVRVTEPDVSKAYYGELAGEPVTYTIDANRSFTLYVNILVPDVAGTRQDVSAIILKDGRVLAALDATSTAWPRIYEPFGGDYYFEGPEYRAKTGPGRHDVVVSTPDNRGKYTLAIGEREEFPLAEVLRTLVVLPTLKREFFGKPAWTAYFNLIGLFIAVPILVLVSAGIVVWVVLARRRKRRARSDIG